MVSDNPNATFREVYTKQLEKMSNYDVMRLRFGDWTVTDASGQEFYWGFDRQLNVTEAAEYKENLPCHISFDQNVNPYVTAIITNIEIIDNTYYINIFDEFCLPHPKNSTRQLCKEIKNKYSLKSGVFFYGDASGNKADTRSEYNDYDIVTQELFEFITNGSNRVDSSNPPILKRRDFENDILRGEIKNIVIRIHPRCVNLIADLSSLKQDQNGKKLKKKTRDPLTGVSYEINGHTSDCLDYLVCGVAKKEFEIYCNKKSITFLSRPN